MSIDQEPGHNPDRYERPLSSHVCGRNVFWQKTCWQGPEANGKCGGAVSCIPIEQNGGYKCTRPKGAGGSCSQGPLPDGSCAHIKPPCVPKPRARVLRRRLGLLVVIISLALIGALSNKSANISSSVNMLEPGDLSDIHTGFTQDKGCESCHLNHNDSLAGWIKTAFTKQELSSGCLKCHSFNEPEIGSHNFSFTSSSEQTECVSCHSEHKGKKSSLTDVSQATCSNCHKTKFDNFVEDHPDFPKKYPSEIPSSIYFDHSKHISEYFVEPNWQNKKNTDKKFSELASKNCTACHEIETASREVKPKPFAQICANCHQSQIRSREFIVMAAESFTPVSALLLGVVEDDEEEDESIEDYQQFLRALSDDSEEALLALAEELEIADSLPFLIKGLNPLLLKNAAEDWVKADEFMGNEEGEIERFGWLAGEDGDGDQTLRYRASGHADPVLRSWIELLLDDEQMALLQENVDSEIIERARDYLLDPREGPGACGKCHGPGLMDRIQLAEDVSPPTWLYRGQVERHFSKYAHGPHIKFLGPEQSCQSCHKLDISSDYTAYFKMENRNIDSFVSNFSAISKEKCAECHQPEKVREDCVMCHNYHFNPGHRETVQGREE